MKRVIRVAPLILAAALTTAAFGQDMTKVSETSHNLNNYGILVTTETGANQVCLPCHIPHNAYTGSLGDDTRKVLWNHQDTGETFQMYFTGADQPVGTSKMCLSCHDGVTAVDNYGGSTTYPPGTVMTGPKAMGTDLSDDHPIGISYPASGPGTGYHDPGGFTGVQLMDVGGDLRVECASCHDPHNNGLGQFLRRTLDESAICLECHDK